MTLTNSLRLFIIVVVVLGHASCKPQKTTVAKTSTGIPEHTTLKPLPANAPPQLKQMIDGAVGQAGVTTGYDPSYVSISYPGGDVNPQTGVCSDVVIRSFRKAGVDLQKEVHEDMLKAWAEYPKRWGLVKPDANIDHRRVPNLMTYFKRAGTALTISEDAADYQPGDVIAWDLGGGIDHIGIVTNIWSMDQHRCLIVHNIGAGARVEDVMFSWPITGHYRYFDNSVRR